jgi:hypothetical protein
MCITGLKKPTKIVEANYQVMELDELYWFIGRKARSKMRENVYIMTVVSRKSRQLVGLEVTTDKSARCIQVIVDNAPEADKYCTDG